MKSTLLSAFVFAVLAALFGLAATDGKLPWREEPGHGPDWCEAHRTALSSCERCNPRLARGGTFTSRDREPRAGECPNTLVRVTLGPGAAGQAGIEVVPAEARPISETIRANAETRYPPSEYARVAPRLAGVIREVKAALGQAVEASAPLALVESIEFGEAKSDYLQALAVLELRRRTHDQEQGLAAKGIGTGRDLLEARTAFEEARLAADRAHQRLRLLGLTGEQIQAVETSRDTSALLEIAAPFAGVVLEASAVIGEAASPDRPVFAVAKVERIWIDVDVYESDLSRIEVDQRVTFTVDGLTGQRFPGKVVAVGGEVDERTRTIRVIADVKNVRGLLRANMFGHAEILVRSPEPRLLVPRDALQNDGDCDLVFVESTPNVFQARKVQVGAAFEGGYEVVGGLAAGERIATTGSFLLKTEVMRGQMGAG